MRRSLAVLAVAPVLMATQCYTSYDLQVSPGPAPKQAVFTGVRDKEILSLVGSTLPVAGHGIRDWYYALMDYGTFLKSSIGNAAAASHHHVRQPAFQHGPSQLQPARLQQSLPTL